jgi:ParB-like chromosome segregation protein Spo0J
VSKQFSIDPKRLRANPWNVNIVTPDNEAKIAESLRQLGQFKPVIVRELYDAATKTDYEILGGEHRWQIALREGTPEIDVYNVGVVSDEIAKKISIADNARYGADDTLALGKLLDEIGDANDLQAILPFSESDINAIFNSSNIALDELDLPEEFDKSDDEKPEAPLEKAPKTHTIMRFKVPIGDAERITELIAKVQKHEGFSGSDELTNAGDALVHVLLHAEKA